MQNNLFLIRKQTKSFTNESNENLKILQAEM